VVRFLSTARSQNDVSIHLHVLKLSHDRKHPMALSVRKQRNNNSRFDNGLARALFIGYTVSFDIIIEFIFSLRKFPVERYRIWRTLMWNTDASTRWSTVILSLFLFRNWNYFCYRDISEADMLHKKHKNFILPFIFHGKKYRTWK